VVRRAGLPAGGDAAAAVIDEILRDEVGDQLRGDRLALQE
jgi:hypothetical protein